LQLGPGEKVTGSSRLRIASRVDYAVTGVATSEEALRDALDGHILRLQRFCHRHRKIVSGELSQLLVCGNGEKLERAVETLGDRLGIEASVLPGEVSGAFHDAPLREVLSAALTTSGYSYRQTGDG
jgi:hypothetical protein